MLASILSSLADAARFVLLIGLLAYLVVAAIDWRRGHLELRDEHGSSSP